MWNQRKNLEPQHQYILFRCKNGIHGPDFVVRVDYTFQVDGMVIRPKEIRYCAGFIEKEKSLAELMIKNQGGQEAMLNWQESIDFGDAELLFDLHKPELGSHYEALRLWRRRGNQVKYSFEIWKWPDFDNSFSRYAKGGTRAKAA